MWQVPEGSISMERLDGETILINFDSGEYFSFQGSSADLLWLISAGVNRESWLACIASAFPDVTPPDPTIEEQINEFLADLVAAGIIVEVGGEIQVDAVADPVLPDDYVRDAWMPPSVHANDDLADLLVIDPIHDTSEDGWPETRSEQSPS